MRSALALLFAGVAFTAQAQTPRPGAAAPQAPAAQPPAAPALDPAQAASKSAFDRLAEAERKAIQNDLIWTGDFNGVAGGEFGRRTYDAMLAFERRSQSTADGILTPPERDALRRDADAARAVLRFAAITDPATGIRIGLPAGLLSQRVAVENGVVHRRPDGAVSLQLGRFPPARSFADLFEELRQDGPGRKVTYRLQRPDWFVVSGEEGGRKFYTRLAQGPEGIRGYTFRYPIAEAARLDRIMIAIANSFEPFPGTDIAANPARATAPPGQPATPSPPALVRPSPTPAETRYVIFAASLGQGRALTSRAALASCASPSINGQPVRTEEGAAGETVSISAAGLSQPAIAMAPAGPPGPVFTLSAGDGPERGVEVAPGRWEPAERGARVTSAIQGAAAGAPVIDGQGRLVGLVREAPKAVRMVAGVVTQASHAVVAVTPAEQGTSAQNLPPSPRLVGTAAAGLVRITCARRL